MIDRQSLLDKIHGGWMGKAIGGTLGAPYECDKNMQSLTFYDPVPTGAVANDDLDLQLIWLHALQVRGIHVNCHDLGEEWLEHVATTAMWDEYNYAAHNMRRGLRSPLSGAYDNPFGDAMGSPIRSEIWAMICPAMPALAAAYAWHDAVVDHGGESIQGEQFLAALESAAFVVDDIDQLIDIGLRYVTEGSRLANAIALVRKSYRDGDDWVQARSRVLEECGRFNSTDSPVNIAFTVIGLLWGGGDLGATICTAVNCGWDTDCTGATAGAIVGILKGASALPAKWLAPIGDDVVVGAYVLNLPTARTLGELAQMTIATAEKVAADLGVELGTPVGLSTESQNVQCLAQSSVLAERPAPDTMLQCVGPIRLQLDLGKNPTVRPGQSKHIGVVGLSSGSTWSGRVELVAPVGWHVRDPARELSGGLNEQWIVEPGDDDTVKAVNRLYLNLPTGGRAMIPLIGEQRWLVAGPFGGNGEAAFDTAFGPEQDASAGPWDGRDDKTNWQQCWLPDCHFETEDRFAGRPGALYFTTDVICPKPGSDHQCRVIVPCTCGVKVWINGEQVVSDYLPGPVRHAAHFLDKEGFRGEASLHPGRNRVLIKVVRDDEPVELTFFLARPDYSIDEQLGQTAWPRLC